jgi:hypothetical protein
MMEEIKQRNRSQNAEVEWERAPVDYDTELTESQLVGERMPPEEVSFRPEKTLGSPERTIHGSRAQKHEGKKAPHQ